MDSVPWRPLKWNLVFLLGRLLNASLTAESSLCLLITLIKQAWGLRFPQGAFEKKLLEPEHSVQFPEEHYSTQPLQGPAAAEEHTPKIPAASCWNPTTDPVPGGLHQTNRATAPPCLSKSTWRLKLKVAGRREGRLLTLTDIFFNYLEIINLILLDQKPWATVRVLSAGTSGSCGRQSLVENPKGFS